MDPGYRRGDGDVGDVQVRVTNTPRRYSAMTRIRDFFRLDDDHPFTGRHMLAVVLLFFGTIIAVNIVDGDLGDRHVPRPRRQEQLRRQPELQPHPRRGPGAGRDRLADGARRRRMASSRSASPTATACRSAARGHRRGRAPVDHRRGPDASPWSRTAPATAPPRRCRPDSGTSPSRPARTASASSARGSGSTSQRRGRLMDARDCHGRAAAAARRSPSSRPPAGSTRPSSASRTTVPATSTSSCRKCIAPPASAGSRTASTPCPASRRARANLTSHRVGIDFDAASGDPDAMLAAIEGAGYSARPFDASAFDAASRDAVGGDLVRCLAVAGFAAGNIMLLSVSVWSGAERRDPRPVPLALGADRAAGDRLCRPALLPLGAPQHLGGRAQHGRADLDRRAACRRDEPLRDGDRRRARLFRRRGVAPLLPPRRPLPRLPDARRRALRRGQADVALGAERDADRARRLRRAMSRSPTSCPAIRSGSPPASASRSTASSPRARATSTSRC